MYDVEHISVSQIRTWLKCNMQWYHRYILKSHATPGMRKALGIGVHAGLAQINSFRMSGVEPDLDTALGFQVQTFDELLENEDYRFDVLSNRDSLIRRGQKVLTAAARQLDTHTGPPMLVEHDITSVNPIYIDGVELKGFVDLVDVNGSIYDFKVSERPKNQGDVNSDIQLSIYNYALNGMQDSDTATKVSLVTVNAGNGMIKSVDSIRCVNHSVMAAAIIQTAIHQIQKSVETGSFIPSVEGWWCSSKYCDYWNACSYGGKLVI